MQNFSPIIKAEVEAICMRPVGQDESLVSSGLLDSVALVDLAVALEKRLGVKISLDSLNVDSFDSLTKIENIVQSRVGK